MADVVFNLCLEDNYLFIYENDPIQKHLFINMCLQYGDRGFSGEEEAGSDESVCVCGPVTHTKKKFVLLLYCGSKGGRKSVCACVCITGFKGLGVTRGDRNTQADFR